MVASGKEEVLAAVKDALRRKVTPSDIIDRGLLPGMREVGERFARYEIYLPGLMLAAQAWEEAMKVLEPELSAAGATRKKVGRVVIGTVMGDIHSIGKNIVAIMLKMNGFELFDLGVDVPASRFVEKAKEVDADIIAASALMTTTMPQQKSIVEYLQATGERDRYRVLVGGACTNQEWADSIGADGYGRTAGDAVTVALDVLSRNVEEGGR